MNKNTLKEYIKSQIREKLYAGPSSVNPAKADPDYGRLKQQEKGEIERTLKTGGSVELEEMARKAVVYKVTEDFKEKAKNIRTGGPISPVKLANTLKFLEGKDETTGPEIALGLGFVDEKGKAKMPAIYPIFDALIKADALVATGDSETEEVSDTPINKNMEDLYYSDVYDKSSAAPEEEEEPEIKSLEKITTTSDPITQVAVNFTLDNDDMIQSLIRTYKESRVRIGEIREEEGDLSVSDYKKAIKQSKESSVERLSKKIDDLVSKIQELEPKVQDKVLKILDFKFKSVDATNLSKIIAKKLGKSAPADVPIETDIEDIEDTDDEIMEDSGVEDVDHDDSSFKDYDSVYERLVKKLKGT
jgi:hypothetical protein